MSSQTKTTSDNHTANIYDQLNKMVNAALCLHQWDAIEAKLVLIDIDHDIKLAKRIVDYIKEILHKWCKSEMIQYGIMCFTTRKSQENIFLERSWESCTSYFEFERYNMLYVKKLMKQVLFESELPSFTCVADMLKEVYANHYPQPSHTTKSVPVDTTVKKYCHECGIVVNGKFCSGCGTKLQYIL
jgi:hypothetical protein